jgi:rod shape-determining protein MreB and related proteins
MRSTTTNGHTATSAPARGIRPARTAENTEFVPPDEETSPVEPEATVETTSTPRKKSSGKITAAVDFGTATSGAIFVQNGDVTEIVKLFPSWISIDEKNQVVDSVGKKAMENWGRVAQGFKIEKPLQGGTIKNISAAEVLLSHILGQAPASRKGLLNLFGKKIDHLIIGIPCEGKIEPHVKVMKEVIHNLSVSRVSFVPQLIAGAYGANLDIFGDRAVAVIDVGGGTSQFGVILKGKLTSYKESIEVAGDAIDDAIKKHIEIRKRTYVSPALAERIKKQACAENAEDHIRFKGRVGNSPTTDTIRVDTAEIIEVISRTTKQIAEVACTVMSSIPPTDTQVSADVTEYGIHLIGGGANLRGLRQEIEEFGFRVEIPKEPQTCVLRGLGLLAQQPELLRAVTVA